MYMKKMILTLLISFAMIMNISFIDGVKAYSENPFTGDQCMTTNAWESIAKTAYTLNATTGLYELSGQTYAEYKASGATTNVVFYGISTDGRILYAYVPNYSGIVQSEQGKTALNNKGILTTATCEGTLKVSKTIVGNAPTEESTDPLETEENNPNENGTNEENTTNEGTATNNTSDNIDSENTVEKIQSPNTASPVAITGVIVSVALVAIAVYVILKKTRPELFERIK